MDTYLFDDEITFTPENDAGWHQDTLLDVVVKESAQGRRTVKLRVDRRDFHDGWDATPTVDELDRLIAVLQRARVLLGGST